MTGQMTEEQLDREIRTFLAWQAEDLAGAPSATDMTLRIGSRVGGRRLGSRPMPRMAWVLVAGLLILALAAVALIGALARRAVDPPIPTAYEAVFVRHEVVSAATKSGISVVVAVDAQGREREITRIPYGGGGVTIPQVGAVSPSGLLVLPRDNGRDAAVHYEIVDLNDPTAPPVVVAGLEQDSEQIQGPPYYDSDPRMGFFWGPDDQIAIPWYERTDEGNRWHVALIDGRTGAGPSVDVPEDGRLLPHWASDGSGVMLGRSNDGADAPAVSAVLRPDGTVDELVPGVAESVYSRRYRPDGVVLETSAKLVAQFDPRDRSYEILVSSADGDVQDAAWTADGDGIWLALRSGADGRDLQLERRVPISQPVAMATIADSVVPLPIGTERSGRFIGLAPDDSMLVLGLDRVAEADEGVSTEPIGGARLVAPESGGSFDIAGTFVGWIEVEP